MHYGNPQHADFIQDEKPCTCHPDDNPPVSCQRKYALTDCRQAKLAALRTRLESAERALDEMDRIAEDGDANGLPSWSVLTAIRIILDEAIAVRRRSLQGV